MSDNPSAALVANTPDQAPTHLVAGALAHLAAHMETGCRRSARLATMLLARIAADPEADDHLRHHAQQLVDILDADDGAVVRHPAGRQPEVCA